MLHLINMYNSRISKSSERRGGNDKCAFSSISGIQHEHAKNQSGILLLQVIYLIDEAISAPSQLEREGHQATKVKFILKQVNTRCTYTIVP